MSLSTPDITVTSGTGFTLSGPDWGEVGRPSATFTVTRDATGPGGSVAFTPIRTNTTPSAATIALTPSSSGSFTLNAADYGSGTLTLTNDGGLGTVTRAFFAKIGVVTTIINQLGNRLDWGGWLPNPTGHLSILNEDISGLPADVLSDVTMARHVALFGVDRKLNWDLANQGYGRSISIVAGDTPLKSLVLGTYINESDPLAIPIIDNPGIGGQATVPPAAVSGDSHAIILERDSKGGFSVYKASRNPTTLQWAGEGLTAWDFANGCGGYPVGTPAPYRPSAGSLRRAGWTSETVAGLPVLSTALRYDEAARGPILHAIRMTIANSWMAQTYCHPARHRSYAGSGATGNLPLGAILRLKADRYEYYLNLFGSTGAGDSHVAANVLHGLRHRGMINTDGTTPGVHPQIDVLLDERWASATVLAEIAKLKTLLMTDFELVRMHRAIEVSANKTWCRAGESVILTANHKLAIDYGDDNSGFNAYFSTLNGNNARTANVVQDHIALTADLPTNHTTWTPQVSDIGTHQLSVRELSGMLKSEPAAFTVLAADAPDPDVPPTPDPDPQPAPGDGTMEGSVLTWGLGSPNLLTWGLGPEADVTPITQEIDSPLFCPDLAGASVAAGTAAKFPFTIELEDERTAATCFLSSNAIAAAIWPGDDYVTVATPAVAWDDAANGTATLTIRNTDTLSLTPGDYRIQVYVTVSGQKFVVHDDTFKVTTSPGSTVIPTVYCTFDMMEALYSGIRTLQKEQSDEAGFLGLRKMARDTIDYAIYTRYRPRPGWNRRRRATADASLGFDTIDRTTTPPTQAELRQLLADDALVIGGPDGTVFREIAARLSVAYVLDRQESLAPGRGFAAKADAFRERAMEMLCCYWAWIDTDGDGLADIQVNRDVMFLT